MKQFSGRVGSGLGVASDQQTLSISPPTSTTHQQQQDDDNDQSSLYSTTSMPATAPPGNFSNSIFL
jgi:hypothetical protein